MKKSGVSRFFHFYWMISKYDGKCIEKNKKLHHHNSGQSTALVFRLLDMQLYSLDINVLEL